MVSLEENLLEKVRRLSEIGIALSSEEDITLILEKILFHAKWLTSADGGTLYTVTPEDKLHFEIISSDSLDYHLGGSSGKPIPFPDIPIFLKTGAPNKSTIVTYAASAGKTVNIKDPYHETDFDFSGPKQFDQHTGYRTKSVLALPIKSYDGKIIAVLQLINAFHPETKKIVSFSPENQYLAESLASEAGVALTNQRLIHDLKVLFESFIRVIAQTIDEKSPSTGNHSRRVPILCELLAQAVNETSEGPLAKTFFSDQEIYELKIAAFLHDCGKITTPVHIMEKHTKLEKIFDRIELIKTRFEVLKREAKIALLEKKCASYEKNFSSLNEEKKQEFQGFEEDYEKEMGSLNAEKQLIERCNRGFESMTPEMKKTLEQIGSKIWRFEEQIIPFLSADELENLKVSYGNLTDKERKIIENHVVLTKKMLSAIPFPLHLKHVAEIAGAHHERVDGKGYPQGLTKEETSIQSRILVVADVFEALSAPDRPYKEALTLSKIIQILQEKVASGHLDKDLVDVFLKKKIPLEYAKKHLAQSQIDVSE